MTLTSIDSTGKVWCAVYTRYQHETNVASLLAGKGFQVFLPTSKARHQWSDRKKLVTIPLFPGYVFFVHDANRRLQVISTPGVHTIVTAGKIPAQIPEEEIEAIRRLVESRMRVEPHPFLKTGDIIRIKSGPLAGLEGIVSREKDLLRLVISVEMLGRSAAVEIDASAVELVAASGSSGQRSKRPQTSDSIPLTFDRSTGTRPVANPFASGQPTNVS